MNKFKFVLLSMLEENGADNLLKAMSCYDMQNEISALNYTVNYICRVMNSFQKEGLVERGLDDRRSITFYITNKGKEKLNEIRGEK